MKWNLFFTCFLLLFSLQIAGQNVSRAYKNYEEGDYARALEILNKAYSSDSLDPAVNFGLAMVYSNPKFENKDYFRAWKYVQVADVNFKALTEDEKKSLGEFLFNLEEHKSTHPLRQKFDLHRSDIENKLIKYVREENDMNMINEFIRDFPHSIFYENVIHIRNYILYSKAASENTLEGYNQFIHDFPDAAQVPQAISRRNRLAFEQAKASEKVEVMNRFISDYPDAEQLLEAGKLRNQWAFEKAKSINTIEGYDEFIRSYPDAVQVSTALKLQKQLVFEKAKQINTFEAYADFLRKYPEAEQYVDVFNLMASALGDKILKEVKYPVQNIAWIKAFDNYGKDDHAASLLSCPDGSVVLIGATIDDSLHSEQGWFVKFDPSMKMVWTKNYGKLLGVSLSAAVLSTSGNILAGGYDLKNPVFKDSGSWYIKLNPQGFKYYDREVNGTNIRTMACTNGDAYVFGGTERDTSGQSHYWIQVLKDSGKRLWDRTYSGKGEISCVKTDGNGKIYFAAGRWAAKTDNNGYIQWEYIPQQQDSLLAMDIAKTGDVVLAGTDGTKQLVVTRLNSLGKPAGRYVFPSIANLAQVAGIRLSASGEMFVIGNSPDYAVCARISNKGQLLNEYRFVSPYHNELKDFIFDSDGKPVLLIQNQRPATGEDIIMLKLK